MNRQEFINTMEAQLKVWDAEIRMLAIKAEKARADLKADLQAQVKALDSKQHAARKRLQEVREKGGDAWEEIRGGVEAAWRDLKLSIEKAVERLK